MTAIVLNTATGAVSEYSWSFDAISPTHAGDASGLYALGGDTDNAAAIDAEVRGGKPGGELLQNMGSVFLAVKGTGDGELVVETTDGTTYTYPAPARPSGVSRAVPGRGIRESRLSLGYRNIAGAAFRLDRIDAEVFDSKTRRN